MLVPGDRECACNARTSSLDSSGSACLKAYSFLLYVAALHSAKALLCAAFCRCHTSNGELRTSAASLISHIVRHNGGRQASAASLHRNSDLDSVIRAAQSGTGTC